MYLTYQESPVAVDRTFAFGLFFWRIIPDAISVSNPSDFCELGEIQRKVVLSWQDLSIR